MRSIPVFAVALHTPRGVTVLELDAPNPIMGLTVGAPITLVYRDGARAEVEFRGHGFASASPEHAHIIVSSPPTAREDLEHIEFGG